MTRQEQFNEIPIKWRNLLSELVTGLPLFHPLMFVTGVRSVGLGDLGALSIINMRGRPRIF